LLAFKKFCGVLQRFGLGLNVPSAGRTPLGDGCAQAAVGNFGTAVQVYAEIAVSIRKALPVSHEVQQQPNLHVDKIANVGCKPTTRVAPEM